MTFEEKVQQDKDLLRGADIITLFGKVDNESFDKIQTLLLREKLAKGNHNPLMLLIDSTGGSVEPAHFIVDFFLAMPFEIVGLVSGQCHSAALTILQGCHKRFALPHSTFLCHSQVSNVPVRMDKDYQKTMRKKYERSKLIAQRSRELYLRRSKLSDRQLKELMRLGDEIDYTFYADEALKKGFIDEIITKIPSLTNIEAN